jgi:multiple sugar transport system permease protein
MLAPYVLGLLVLVVLPTAATFGLALTEYDLVRAPSWVGLGNFQELVTDDVFRIALGNTFSFALVATPLRLLIALGLALLLHERFFGVGAARTAVVLPSIVPEVAYGLLWLWLLNPIYGPVNAALDLIGPAGYTAWGFPLPQWLTHANDARAAVILMSLFTIGEAFIVLLVARMAVPRELYEVASVEDATSWTQFRRITLPLIAPILVLVFLRDLVVGLQLTFVPALIVTEGGPPPYATTYVSLFAYRNAFEYLRYGYAAAAVVVLFVLTALVVAVQLGLLRRWRRRWAL